jgi:DNA polymerase III subunit delta'
MKSSAASADVTDLPVLKVLARARAEGRMPHAVLLTGNDGAVLARAAEQLAAMHLGEADPLAHPDCRVLRPAKKSRRIVIENVLEVVAALRLSSLTPRRVVIVNEPDRFLSESANAFLKTLEEPPPGTLIILQTTHYYRVLPTILSRCLRFHVGGEAPVIADPSWQDWLREMERLLTRMVKGPASPQARVSEVFIPLYALCARFEVLLELFVEEALEAAPPPPPTDEDEDDAEAAYEESVRRGVRARMLVSVEEKLRLVGRAHPGCAGQVAEAVGHLEDARRRMELNYQVLAAFEQFLLRTLRTFALRPRDA